MAQPGAYSQIQHYYTTTALATPAPANVVAGELAINVTDRKIYTKDGGGNIVPLGNVGDVTLTGVQTLTNKTLTSVVLDGIPVAPTAAPGTNTTQVATMAAIQAAMLTFGAVAFVPGAAYTLNQVAVSNVNFQVYRHTTASSSLTTDPSLDSTNWTLAIAIPPAVGSTIYLSQTLGAL